MHVDSLRERKESKEGEDGELCFLTLEGHRRKVFSSKCNKAERYNEKN